jgi:DNA mismatch endonuclease, patch repair protein
MIGTGNMIRSLRRGSNKDRAFPKFARQISWYHRAVSAKVVAMTDTRTPDQRRRIMQSVKTKDTGPEWVVRRILHALGYRYRLHRKDLPGSPDIVFPARRKAILVHGCFWHGHGCAKGRGPKSRTDYWAPKIEANRARDERNMSALKALGWDVLVLWQCELANAQALSNRLVRFVDGSIISIDKGRARR